MGQFRVIPTLTREVMAHKKHYVAVLVGRTKWPVYCPWGTQCDTQCSKRNVLKLEEIMTMELKR